MKRFPIFGFIIMAALFAFPVKGSAQPGNPELMNDSVKEEAITVNLYYTGKNGSARMFVEEMESSGTADSIRHEKGNLRYDYFQSLSDPETVLLIDSWSSQAAIDAHHASPMMTTLARLREKYDLHMRVERYRKDGHGVPPTDDKFIRH